MSDETKDLQEEIEVMEDTQTEAHSNYVPASGNGEDVRHQLTGMYQNWFLDYASYVILERADEPTEDGTPLNADVLNAVMDSIENAQNTAAKMLNRTTAVNEANTEYEKYIARGTSINSAEVNPAGNGLIAWTFK